MTASCARARRWPGGHVPVPFGRAPETSVWSVQGAVGKVNLRVTLVTLRDKSLRRHGHPGSHRFVLTSLNCPPNGYGESLNTVLFRVTFK